MTTTRNKFWTFRNAEKDKPAELLIYGEIADMSWWGDEVTPKQFKKDLDKLGDVDEIAVFINSLGGDVFAGQAIHSMLKRHKATISVYIDGIAASAASIIAMAGDTIKMPKNAMMMVHNPWTWAIGYAADFRKVADDLDKIREAVISAYQVKTGLSPEEIGALLDAETWMTAEEAVEKGFADEAEEAKQVAAKIEGRIMTVNGLGIDIARAPNPAGLLRAIPTESPPKPQDKAPEPIEQERKALLDSFSTLELALKNKYGR
jgi:ATP-dependent Clp protease protease subunit